VQTFVEHLMWETDGSFEELMTAPYSFVNGPLASHYGVQGPSGADFEKVEMPGRAGVLTLGGVVAAHDKPTRTSIVLRGLKIRTDVLCQNIGAPPPNVVTDLPDVNQTATQAERLKEHRTNPTCASCHDLMDPIGGIFEGFDAVGRARKVDEHGAPISTAGELTRTTDADGPVSGPVELATRLSKSQEVRDCFLTQTFRFFYGRDHKDADNCSEQQLSDAFEASDHSLMELIVALTQTDAFLYRPSRAGGEP
jgi:hypothetical protein